jgi:enoyl-CoA hydratase
VATQRIASRIGAARAAEMVFTAAILPPETLASWGLINRVLPAGRLAREGRAVARSLATGPTRAHAAKKRMLHAWRSGGVAADRVTHAVGPPVMLSRDLQDGLASLQRSGPGHAAVEK